jgi:hypothetical protein
MSTASNETAEMPRFGNLSNKEIILTYHKMKGMVDQMEENLLNLRIQKVTPKGITYRDITKEQAEKLKSSEYYTVIHDVVKTLNPIVELLEDCDAELKKFSNGLKKNNQQ